MFGKIVNGKFEQAPKNLQLEDGSLIVNFNENETLMTTYGYKQVIENPPTYDTKTEYLKMVSFEETDTTITPTYEVVNIESRLEESTDMEEILETLRTEMLNARKDNILGNEFGSLSSKLDFMMKYFSPEEIFTGADLPNDGKYKLWFVTDGPSTDEDDNTTDTPNPTPGEDITDDNAVVVGTELNARFIPYYFANTDDTAVEGYPTKLYCSSSDASLLGKYVKIFNTGTTLDGKKFLVNEIIPDSSLTTDAIDESINVFGICCESEEQKNNLTASNGKAIVGVLATNQAEVVTISEGIGMNVRSGMGVSNPKIGYVYDGTKCLVLEKYDNTTWIKILYKGKEGYINGADKYVTWGTIELDGNNNPVGIEDYVRFPVKCKGMDISKHNGTINWKSVKEGNEVKFAILRLGYGSRTNNGGVLDSQFKANVEACKKYNIPIGVYFFSYASSLTKLKAEANWVIEQLANYPATFELPIFFDQEYDSLKTVKNSNGSYTSKNPGKTTLTNYINTFCDMLEAAGYKTGVYSNVDWLINYVNFNDVMQRDLWLARWGTDNHNWTQSPVKIWQFGSYMFSGMPQEVDGNICYVDYPSLIKSENKNGF